MTAPSADTIRLTTAQALVRFLGAQHTVRDGERERLFAGCYGIFGHGNLAGVGQALQQESAALGYVPVRNEQAAVHMAVAWARARQRRSTWAVTTSIGPGATNLVTGAALATINRLPVLLLPGDTFATRPADPVLQQLEQPYDATLTANDTLRPVSRYFDRISRPEQLIPALLQACRVLTDPAETGAVTIALPQDVQAEAWDFPLAAFAERDWVIQRSMPDFTLVADAVRRIRASKRPVIIAGGGVHYSAAEEALSAFAHTTGIHVAETQAGVGSVAADDPASLGAVGVTGSIAARDAVRDADLIIGVGTRYSDFTTMSATAFADDVSFININVASFDASKQAALPLVGDARETLRRITSLLDAGPYHAPQEWSDQCAARRSEWQRTAAAWVLPTGNTLSQAAVIGIVNDACAADGTVVCAAGSMPGDLHVLWRSRDPRDYHVEYGYSCMGYEVAGGIGAARAMPQRRVHVLVGDGSWLMMSSDIVTAVLEGIDLTVVLVDNGGYGSIGALSESLGSARFGTALRARDGAAVRVDYVANAASLGAHAERCSSSGDLASALANARTRAGVSVIVVDVDPEIRLPDRGTWWHVPVAEVSTMPEVAAAFDSMRAAQARQRLQL